MAPYPRPTHPSRLYRDFRAMEGNAYYQIVRFFEEHEAAIRQLDFEEWFEMLLAYTNALFEMGAYRKHLLMVDTVIEATMEYSIRAYRGEDVFRQSLFKKAASLFNIGDHARAEHVLQQTIRIYPGHTDAIRFLLKCRRTQRSGLLQNSRAVATFLFLLSALVICLELLVVRSFYTMHVPLVEASRNSIFLLGLFTLAGGHLGHRFRADRTVRRFIKEARQRK